MIDIQNIEFRYPRGDFQLQIPSLAINQGSSVAIIGPSGTGKSTFLNLVAGISVPDEGLVTVNGVEISSMDDKARRAFRIRNMGLVFQQFELLDYLNVLDNILLPYRTSRMLTLNDTVKKRAAALAERTGIQDKLKRNIRRLSQGECQRAALCRAILPEPGLLLCDEPTGNLDPANSKRVLDTLFNDVSERGSTLIVVTHDYEHLDRFDRVVDFAEFQSSSSATTSGELP